MLSTLIGYFASTLGVSYDFIDTIQFRTYANFPMAICFLIPISLLRDLTALAFVSMLSLLSLAYTCILMFVELPYYNAEYRAKPDFVEQFFVVDWNFFTAASMCFFAFTCQMQLIPIYSELVRPSYKRMSKVVTRSLTIDFLFYTAICSAGYFSTYNYSNQIIIARPPLPNFDPDYCMIVASAALCVVLCAAFPCNYNPWRNQFFTLIMKTPNYSNKA